MDIIETFKTRLQQMLEAKKLSAAEFSRLSGINKSSMSRYLSGERLPRAKVIASMARVLEVEPGWLLGSDITEPVVKAPYNPIDYSKLSKKNKIRIVAYYQALLDTQADNAEKDS
jgi:transcriptional regulator with XRE-family HTH domain